MTDSKTFDRDGVVKDMTTAGLARPIAEAMADEFAYLDPLHRGETADARTFEKDQCVKRLTEAGLARPIAEVVANRYEQLDAYLRGQCELRRDDS